jgi:hypothetical protein
MMTVLGRVQGRLSWHRWVMAGCLIVAGSSALGAAASDAFTVQSASMRLVGDVYRLSAVMNLDLPSHVVEAIENGLPITLDTVLQIERPRWYWWNATVAKVELRSQLSYHALSQQYLVRDLETGRQRGYLSLQEALADLSVVFDRPVLNADVLEPEREYKARVRVQLDRFALPAVLRAEGLLGSRWKLQSDWFEWDLVR